MGGRVDGKDGTWSRILVPFWAGAKTKLRITKEEPGPTATASLIQPSLGLRVEVGVVEWLRVEDGNCVVLVERGCTGLV